MKQFSTLTKVFFGLTLLLSLSSCNITDYMMNEKGQVTNKSTGEVVDEASLAAAETEALAKGRLIPFR